MQCNIDAAGKAHRLKWGLIVLAIGVLLAVCWAWPTGAAVSWVVAAAALAGGGFMIFEARAGGRAIRAMGLRTKI